MPIELGDIVISIPPLSVRPGPRPFAAAGIAVSGQPWAAAFARLGPPDEAALAAMLSRQDALVQGAAAH